MHIKCRLCGRGLFWDSRGNPDYQTRCGEWRQWCNEEDMDNQKFDITSESDRALELSIELVMTRKWTPPEGERAYFWLIDPPLEDRKVSRLIISMWKDPRPYYHDGYKDEIQWTAFLTPLDHVGLTDQVKRFLASADYGPDPGHDGSNGRGFRVYNEAWARIGNCWTADFAVEPSWAWYGK